MSLKAFFVLPLLRVATALYSPAITTYQGPAPSHLTETRGLIRASYAHPNQATTSLTGIPSYTTTSASSHSIAYTNSTSPPAPTATGNGTLPACKKVQYDFPAGQGGNATRAAAVVEAYQYAWNGYKEYAFGKDELLPLSKSYTQDWYGWGVTIVDGIDTAIVMNLTDIVEEQLAYIQTIDFTTTKYGPVEIFDTSIRYIGGLLSSHDLLRSGLFPNSYNQDQVNALLAQAVTLANKVAYGFDTPTGIASTNVNFTSNTPVQGTYTVGNVTYNSTNTASAGTFLLDWLRLTDLTGNTTYQQLVERGESYLVNPNPAPVYPGLVGTQFDVDTGRLLSFDGGWHSGVDSFLEYTLKSYYYKQTSTTTEYKDFWLQAVQSTIEYIALHPYNFPDLTFISELDVNGTITETMDDYSCFAGGNFLLGCKALDMPELCDLGIAAADGCHQTYNTTLTGLGPLYWGWYNSSNEQYDPTEDNDAAARKFAAEYGYFIEYQDETWADFPESIESWFYAYRITGDQRWADYVWEVFLAINETARNDVAFTHVNNVNMPFGGSQADALDSFFFAEVLKYIYLTFADPNVVNLDQFVFNTESHPLLVQCGDGNIDNSAGAGTASAMAGSARRRFEHAAE
ncbi:MAG: maturation of Asn-linked oligosaccharides protein [Bathelium mastoideum]|nr:MAG: maturation of Asn-linked oligosaccharides protein [Bathelium mastoideum]